MRWDIVLGPSRVDHLCTTHTGASTHFNSKKRNKVFVAHDTQRSNRPRRVRERRWTILVIAIFCLATLKYLRYAAKLSGHKYSKALEYSSFHRRWCGGSGWYVVMCTAVVYLVFIPLLNIYILILFMFHSNVFFILLKINFFACELISLLTARNE